MSKWKMFTGNIEVEIEAKTEADAKERLEKFAKQLISQNADVYRTKHRLLKKKERVTFT